MTDSTTPSGGDVTTVHAALEVSGTSWILAVGDPTDASEAGLHRLASHDVAGLPGKLGRARERAAAVSGGDVRVMLVCEVGYEGFRVARRPGGEDLEVVVRHPASLEVVRRRRKAKTDRTGASGSCGSGCGWQALSRGCSGCTACRPAIRLRRGAAAGGAGGDRGHPRPPGAGRGRAADGGGREGRRAPVGAGGA